MKKQASWLLVAAFLSGMAGCGKKIPEDIIQPDAMESLLYDYHLASTMSSSVSYTENYKKDAYFKYVFQKHHVTEEEFDSSMVWYTRNSDQLATIYQNLQKRFENEEKHMKVQVAKRDNQIDVSMSGDTVDVWQDRTLYWLSASVLTNKLMFDLKADTTFKPHDAMELTADFHFMPENGRPSGKAVMALNFYFDNDSVQGLTRIVSSSGKQRLYVRADSAFTIRSISGFVYYTDEKNPKSSVLIDDIHLTRYHNMEKEQELVANTIQKVDLPDTESKKVRLQEKAIMQPMRKIENRK